MKNKKGFTLVELLAVIVVLGILMVIATTSVLKNIKTSKEKARYAAAKEIIPFAEIYFSANSTATSVSVVSSLSNYLDNDSVNPQTGENNLLTTGSSHVVCRGAYHAQSGFSDNSGTGYYFDGYFYSFTGSCPTP